MRWTKLAFSAGLFALGTAPAQADRYFVTAGATFYGVAMECN